MRSTRAVTRGVAGVAADRAQEAGLQLHRRHRLEAAERASLTASTIAVSAAAIIVWPHSTPPPCTCGGVTGSASTTSPGARLAHAQRELAHPRREGVALEQRLQRVDVDRGAFGRGSGH